MPAAEVDVTIDLVSKLLADQRPDLAGQSLSLLGSGWDNVCVRIGDRLVGRFPRRAASVTLIHNEASWLPALAPLLPLPIPVPEFVGTPDDRYPWPWSIAPFLPGAPAHTVDDLDQTACAIELGDFLVAMHSSAPSDAPENPFRGVPLEDRDSGFRDRLPSLSGVVDIDRVRAIWERGLRSDPYSGAPVWLHGDFQPHNLLASDGRIVAVTDFGDITSGDPATDLSIAWCLLDPEVRPLFWSTYGANDVALIDRSRAWALNLGTAILANSSDNPEIEAVGRRTVTAVLRDDV